MSITWGPSMIRQWILKVLVVGTFENLRNWYHKTTYTGPLSSPFSGSIHYLVLDASVNKFSAYHWDYYEFLAWFPCFSESMFTKVEVVHEGGGPSTEWTSLMPFLLFLFKTGVLNICMWSRKLASSCSEWTCAQIHSSPLCLPVVKQWGMTSFTW